MKSIPWDSSWPRLVEPSVRAELLGYWSLRFGVPPAIFAPYELMASSRTVYLVRKSEHLEDIATLTVQQAGLPFIRKVAGHLKPTTVAVQRFGHLATRNVFDLEDDLRSFVEEGELEVELDNEEAGYIIVKSFSHIWGCGLFLPPGRLLCRFPKKIKSALLLEEKR